MTKRDLIVWLKETAENVIDDISSKKDKALEAYEEKVIEEIGLNDIANEIQKKFTEIDEIIRTWKSEINSDYQDIVLRDDYYGSTTSYRIHRYIDEPTATNYIMQHSDLRIENSKGYKKIYKNFNEIIKKTEEEYRRVIINVKSLKTVKLGVEYLESLGFDLTELKEADQKPLVTALSVPINTDYLFIKRDDS